MVQKEDLIYLDELDIKVFLNELHLDSEMVEELPATILSQAVSSTMSGHNQPDARKAVCIRDVIDGLKILNECGVTEPGGNEPIHYKELVIRKGQEAGDVYVDFTQYQNQFDPQQYNKFENKMAYGNRDRILNLFKNITGEQIKQIFFVFLDADDETKTVLFYTSDTI